MENNNNCFTNDEIKEILLKYVREKEYRNTYYKNKYHTDEEYREKQKERSRLQYAQNADKRKATYEKNKIFNTAKKTWKYYIAMEKIEYFKEKHPDMWDLVKDL